MGATQADLSLGVDPEIAPPRLAGEAGHLHKKQLPQARGPETANSTRNKPRPPEVSWAESLGSRALTFWWA
jgi:hypothetical protein